MVTPFYYPPIGGAEISAENLAIQLNAKNVVTDVMTFNVDPRWKLFSKTKIHGINVIGIPALDIRPLKIPELMFQIQFFKRRGIDFPDPKFAATSFNEIDLSFPVFSYRVSKPKIFHCRCFPGMFHLYKRNPLSQHLFRDSADLYIVISENLVKYLVDLRISKEKIRVIPNGIDVKKFHPSGEKAENMLLFVGRFEPIKGLHVLLQALKYLTTPVQLVIIGAPSWNRPYSEKMLDLIKKTGEKTVHKMIYLGQLKRERIIKWYQKASIHVRPDTMGMAGGNTAVEAMACGTPVIGTGNHVVKDGINGILVPPNNAIRLTKEIEFLINNRSIRQKLGRESRKFVVENFSFEVIIQKIIQVYKEMLEARK